jgi:nitrate reductase NapD
VSDRIAAIPGALIHGSSPAGKLVVTLDATSADEMLARVSEIQRTDGVLSAALVYQYGGGLEAADAEVCHAG